MFISITHYTWYQVKLACQRCHGNIEEMDEVYQFADLSMGWCVNCHRETKVQFADNNYYSIFQKYHDEIKEGKRTDVKVSDIGGLNVNVVITKKIHKISIFS
jgi:hypothetical protein